METKNLVFNMLIVLFISLTITTAQAQTTKSVKEYKTKVDSIIVVLEKIHNLAEQQYNRTGDDQYFNTINQELELIRLFKIASKTIIPLINFETKIKNKKNIGLILLGTKNGKTLKAIKSIKWLTKTFVLMKDIILVDGSLSNDSMVKNIPELKFPYNIKKLKKIYYWGYRSKLIKKIKQN